MKIIEKSISDSCDEDKSPVVIQKYHTHFESFHLLLAFWSRHWGDDPEKKTTDNDSSSYEDKVSLIQFSDWYMNYILALGTCLDIESHEFTSFFSLSATTGDLDNHVYN